MNIAVFADLHGRILLCFKLCARWERETGETIDLILQAGDLGVYPATGELDRATVKHARKDPTELGFATDFASYHEEVAETLSQTTCPMLFVRGNHEDHDWLDVIERQYDTPLFPIDAYARIFCLKTGVPYLFQKGDETIRILGIGRIGPLPGEQDETKSKYIQPYELERLYSAESLACDVLLTHDVALHALSRNTGMEEIRLVLDAYQPVYHFHGHTEAPFNERIDDNGITTVIKLTDLHWDTSTHNKAIEAGAMGILQWHNHDEHSFSVVTADWLEDYTFKNWRNVE